MMARTRGLEPGGHTMAMSLARPYWPVPVLSATRQPLGTAGADAVAAGLVALEEVGEQGALVAGEGVAQDHGAVVGGDRPGRGGVGGVPRAHLVQFGLIVVEAADGVAELPEVVGQPFGAAAFPTDGATSVYSMTYRSLGKVRLPRPTLGRSTSLEHCSQQTPSQR